MAKSYYITSRHQLSGGDPMPALEARVRQAMAAGVDFVQLREKDLTAAALLDLLVKLLQDRPATETKLLVNGRPDIAAAGGAFGVHLSAAQLPLAALRSQLSQLQFIGVSCHNEKEVEVAEAAQVDYLLLGPIFDTPSKPGAEPLGLERLAGICRIASRPVYALGGVNRANAAQCVHAGAAGIAGIRLFQDEKNLPELVAEISRL